MNHQPVHNSIRITLPLFLVAILVIPAAATIYAVNGTEIRSGDLTAIIQADPSLTEGGPGAGTVIFFTNTRCGSCRAVHGYLDELVAAHPGIHPEIHDLSSSTGELAIFEEYRQKYQVPYLSTPSVVVGDLALEGSQDIRGHLAEIITLQQETASERIAPVPDPVRPAAGSILGSGGGAGSDPVGFLTGLFR